MSGQAPHLRMQRPECCEIATVGRHTQLSLRAGPPYNRFDEPGAVPSCEGPGFFACIPECSKALEHTEREPSEGEKP